jgi:hypothetical protein
VIAQVASIGPPPAKNGRRQITVEELHAELKAQGVSAREHFAFRCVACGTVQSAKSLIRAGAGTTFEEVEKYLGFSCFGRWTNAGPRKKNTPPGRGCDWTLGGLFTIHKLEILTPEGKACALFEPATPTEAQQLEQTHQATT